ncbi:hypothetical protein DFJ58DRAFT_837180 [Suillus subalutaceus]|uniref:uncharacterized protein n=1 Tax=Suillus subalutaceus TaxID=48586 RepID=UPI001B878480|nr:uncharacterized protein DFJ58DRAFT_837180 [Suillus subalutaceus]KAG1871204.1 hypothetical protein DFJ58DRAFT_837180 [Suillus subalutaceus]
MDINSICGCVSGYRKIKRASSLGTGREQRKLRKNGGSMHIYDKMGELSAKPTHGRKMGYHHPHGAPSRVLNCETGTSAKWSGTICCGRRYGSGTPLISGRRALTSVQDGMVILGAGY